MELMFEPVIPIENRVSVFQHILAIMPEITRYLALNALHSCDLSVTEIGSARFNTLVDDAKAARTQKVAA